jgi:hypothetical protein
MLNSCINVFDEDNEYVSVYVTNNTGESIRIYTGLYLVADLYVIIPNETEKSVLVLKGARVRAVGDVSDKTYSSRTFYYNSTWII